MAGYDWVYGRSRGAADRNRGRHLGPAGDHPRPRNFGAYDAYMRRYDAGMSSGWGDHLGESYIENYGSYGTEPGAESHRDGFGNRDQRFGTGWGGGPRYDRGFGRWGWEMVRGRYGGDFGPHSPRERLGEHYGRGGRSNFGGRYDQWRRGWHRGG